MMMQMTAFKGDEAGAAYFANPEGPPPCAAFNYCVVVMDMGADGEFGIKPSAWKQGDADAYTFKLADLTPLTFADLGNVGLWCKAPTPKAAATTAPAAEAKKGAKSTKPRADSTPWLWAGVVLLIVLGLVMAMRFGRRK